MAGGIKKHLKRIRAPHHWMLSKMGGTWAPRPSTGPHKRRECLPLVVLLRNRLRYALNFREATLIVKEKHGLVMVDGKVRKDAKYPTGFMDVISLPQSKEHFRLLYDTKGRFQILRIDEAEAKFKLCKVKNRIVGPNHVPYIITHDGRTFRYPHPDIKINDSIKLELGTGEISDFIKMEMGNTVMVTGGKNTGRVGTLSYLERHEGGFDIVHVKDAHGNMFATRLTYAFVIGKGRKHAVSLPKGDGVKKSILEEQAEFIKKQAE